MNTWFKSAFFAGAALAVFGLAPQAFAQEATCELEVGAAFGFCTAYCVAMDCDGTPQASQTACDKVLGQWNQKTDFRDIPCGVVATTQICPLEAAAVTTICGALPAGTDYFFVEAKGPSTSADSPGICLCSTTITECDPEFPAGSPDACGTGDPFRGSDSIDMATSGTGTCDTVCRTIGGSRRCFNLCF